MTNPPDEHWVVWLSSDSSFRLDDTAAEVLRVDMRNGIVEYSEVNDIAGEPMMIPLRSVELVFRSTPRSRALNRQLDDNLKAERGFDG